MAAPRMYNKPRWLVDDQQELIFIHDIQHHAWIRLSIAGLGRVRTYLYESFWSDFVFRSTRDTVEK